MKKFKVTLFVFLSSLVFAKTVWASNQYLTNTATLRYVYNGRTYTIPKNQTFTGDCRSGGSCVIRANGVRLAVPMQYIRSSSANASYRTQSSYGVNQSYSSELSNGFGYTPRQSSIRYPSSSFNSGFAQCFKNRGDYYTARGGCTSGNRGCTYSKIRTKSTLYCFRYVKLILQDCGATNGYLANRHAKNAGPELLRSGFKKLPITDPVMAPIGSVIVYDNVCRTSNPSGHIEIKTGFSEYMSDYVDNMPISYRSGCRRVSGIYLR